MIAELEKLEERIVEAADVVRTLREENKRLCDRIALLEQERLELLQERSAFADRIGKLVDKVDALRLEL